MTGQQASVNAGLLRLLRQARGLSQTQLADLAGVHQSSVSDIERGKVTDPRFETVAAIAAALGVPSEDLRPADADLGTGGPPYFARVIPRDERPSAGAPIGEQGEPFYFPVSSASEARQELHLFRISGECMRGLIEDGDEVLVRAVQDWRGLRPGSIVIARHGDELLCKRVVRVGDQAFLIADNGTSVQPNGDTRIEGVVWKIIKQAPPG